MSNIPLYVGSRAAADFGNPAFRAWWIAKAQAAVAAGYRGLFIDDVFMERRTYFSGGTALRNPKDPRTGTTMTEANWQKYLADFMVEVRAALPSAEIVARRALAEGRQRQRAARPAGRGRRLGRRRLHHQRVRLELRHARELG